MHNATSDTIAIQGQPEAVDLTEVFRFLMSHHPPTADNSARQKNVIILTDNEISLRKMEAKAGDGGQHDTNDSWLTQVRTLRLSNNGITSWLLSEECIPLAHMVNLTSLTLSENALSCVHASWWRGTPHLKELSLQKNRLRDLGQRNFVGLSCLTSLNLAENRIIDLTSGCFEGIIQLSSFHVC